MLSGYVKEMKNGDMSHFEAFYEETKKQVFYNILAILQDHQLSEDVLQDSYVKFLDKLPTLDEEENVLGYLFVISRNIALDVLRKKKTEENYIQNYEEDNNHYYEESVIDFDIFEKMKKILKKEEYEVVVMHVVNSMTHGEIAKLINKPLGTVTWLYSSAMSKLRKEW